MQSPFLNLRDLPFPFRHKKIADFLEGLVLRIFHQQHGQRAGAAGQQVRIGDRDILQFEDAAVQHDAVVFRVRLERQSKKFVESVNRGDRFAGLFPFLSDRLEHRLRVDTQYRRDVGVRRRRENIHLGLAGVAEFRFAQPAHSKLSLSQGNFLFFYSRPAHPAGSR
ncbi:MAG: hypothetical protein M5R36_04760 [Deltaproteobacteria bacterium]|nr:hypothetical protein [Deltaproteobacteria bacterium]